MLNVLSHDRDVKVVVWSMTGACGLARPHCAETESPNALPKDPLSLAMRVTLEPEREYTSTKDLGARMR